MQRVFSIWKNKSKNGKTYYTGKLGDLSLIGFNNVKENEKQPDVIFYVREQQKKDETKVYTKDLTNDPFEEFGDSVNVEDDMLD
jgi:hypothetical protein